MLIDKVLVTLTIASVIIAIAAAILAPVYFIQIDLADEIGTFLARVINAYEAAR